MDFEPLNAEEIIEMSIERESWLRAAFVGYLTYLSEKMHDGIGSQEDARAVLQKEILSITKKQSK